MGCSLNVMTASTSPAGTAPNELLSFELGPLSPSTHTWPLGICVQGRRERVGGAVVNEERRDFADGQHLHQGAVVASIDEVPSQRNHALRQQLPGLGRRAEHDHIATRIVASLGE